MTITTDKFRMSNYGRYENKHGIYIVWSAIERKKE